MTVTCNGYKTLRRDFENCRKDGWNDRDPNSPVNTALREGLEAGHLKPEEFRLKALFQNLVPDGFELLEQMNPNNANPMSLMEAGTAVNTAAFANITGQIVYSKVMDSYNAPGFIGDLLMPTIPTEFNGEKIPGITDLGDVVETVKEESPYPTAGVGEVFIETPETDKRGVIVPVTREAVFFDRTGLVLRRAGAVGNAMRVNKEKRQLDTAFGITTSYRRNGGAAQATYGNTHTNGDFDNLSASTPLSDWESIETAELLFDAITDPDTGEPIVVMPNTLIVPSALKHTARMIVNATGILKGSGAAFTADPTDNVEYQSQTVNPLDNYTILTNQYVKARTSSATTWFIGDPKKAFAYMENWPMQVVEAPANNHDQFHRDIVAQYKVSERGAPAVLEPRAMVKCTA